MLILGILIVGCVVYAYQGSLELFPTEEQEEKVDTFATFGIVLLIVGEGVLFVGHTCLQKKVRQANIEHTR